MTITEVNNDTMTMMTDTIINKLFTTLLQENVHQKTTP